MQIHCKWRLLKATNDYTLLLTTGKSMEYIISSSLYFLKPIIFFSFFALPSFRLIHVDKATFLIIKLRHHIIADAYSSFNHKTSKWIINILQKQKLKLWVYIFLFQKKIFTQAYFNHVCAIPKINNITIRFHLYRHTFN